MMRILSREDCQVVVHVHADFSGDAIIVVGGGAARYAEIPVALLMSGDFDVAGDCSLTDREIRTATSIALDGYLTAFAGAGKRDMPGIAA